MLKAFLFFEAEFRSFGESLGPAFRLNAAALLQMQYFLSQ